MAPDESTSQGLSATQKRKARFVVAAAVGMIALLLLFPESPGQGIILCPFRFVTGWSCPGCGMTRSCTAAVHGDFWHSLSLHPLGILFVLGMTLAGIRRAVELVRDRPIEFGPRIKRAGHVVSVGVLIFVLGFGGVRLALEIAGIIAPV